MERPIGLMASCMMVVAIACSSDDPVVVAGGGSSSVGGSGGNSSGGGNGGGGGQVGECLEEHHFPIAPDYHQFSPVVGSHCKGTNHQEITGVEKLVFLGDSITQGTPPTLAEQFYRTLLGDALSAKFPGLEIVECAENGAQVDDLLGAGSQIEECFPAAEPKRTLVAITMGGNDVIKWAEDQLPYTEAEAKADEIAAEFRSAIEWFYADSSRFPAGVFVVFSNVYEYTDGTGELESCPAAGYIGLSGDYIAGATALSRLEELYMATAVDTGADMVFMLEEFCGHGYRRDLMNTCYRGPDAELWFDLTCIHPNPTGHKALADAFFAVIDE